VGAIKKEVSTRGNMFDVLIILHLNDSDKCDLSKTYKGVLFMPRELLIEISFVTMPMSPHP
jgi:hypothetical protein